MFTFGRYFQRLEPVTKDMKLEQQRIPKFQQKVEESQVRNCDQKSSNNVMTIQNIHYWLNAPLKCSLDTDGCRSHITTHLFQFCLTTKFLKTVIITICVVMNAQHVKSSILAVSTRYAVELCHSGHSSPEPVSGLKGFPDTRIMHITGHTIVLKFRSDNVMSGCRSFQNIRVWTNEVPL